MRDRLRKALYRRVFGPYLIHRLRFEPGDSVVFRIPNGQIHPQFVVQLVQAFGEKVPIIVLSGEMTLERIPRERLLLAAEMAKPSALDHGVWI